MSSASDTPLILKCLAGDEAAWNALVDRYTRLVYSIPRRYGLSDADAADVHQNVFVAAFRHLERLRDHDRLSSWLITTTHRECWRVGRRTRTTGDLDQIIEDVGSPSDEHLEQWEQQDLVRRGLEELGNPCRDLLSALFLEPGEESYESIARRLGMKVGSIGPTRVRCFSKLEAILRRMGLDDPGLEDR
jgi:RNA polymerase sigma factor (sigma-70 family)